jgi:hypothetical protein
MEKVGLGLVWDRIAWTIKNFNKLRCVKIDLYFPFPHHSIQFAIDVLRDARLSQYDKRHLAFASAGRG